MGRSGSVNAMGKDLSERIISSTVEDADTPLRLDLWLSGRFTYNSRSRWQELIKASRVLVNGKKSRSSKLLNNGDTVSFLPDKEEPEVDNSHEIVFEDEYFFIVDKSGNLPCHPAGPFFKNTLWHNMSLKHGKVYIVNRLDRETSGLVLVAKKPESAGKLSDLFVSGKVTKKYLAIVFGEFVEDIRAEGFLVSDTSSEVRKKRKFVFDSADGESAATFFKPVKTDRRLSMVEAKPATGRLHQIRATLCSLGFPLAGDKLYGPDDTVYIRFVNGKMTEEDTKKLILPRQALHAASLEFTHPFKHTKLKFSAPCPKDITPQGF